MNYDTPIYEHFSLTSARIALLDRARVRTKFLAPRGVKTSAFVIASQKYIAWRHTPLDLSLSLFFLRGKKISLESRGRVVERAHVVRVRTLTREHSRRQIFSRRENDLESNIAPRAF